MSVIEISQVNKSFRRKEVLNDVTLSVPKGVVFALLGENGAGKSTLIRGMLGFQKFSSGSVTVAGVDPARQPLELRKKVGYVSDAPGLYEWMSVAQCGWYASGFYPDGFLTAYDLLTTDFELPPEAKIRDLSKGMRAKVALSLAMASNPELLILDEPTSGLDPLVRRTFLESMIDRAAAGQTVFLSSHQINEVERVADWIAILHEGRIRISAPLEELKSSISMLTYSVRDVLLAEPSELDGVEILSHYVDGRTTQSLVRGLTDEMRSRLSSNANVFDVNVIRPNLEELYLGLTQKNKLTQPPRSASSEVA